MNVTVTSRLLADLKFAAFVFQHVLTKSWKFGWDRMFPSEENRLSNKPPPSLIYWKRRCILYIFLTFLFPHIFTVIFPQPRNWKLAGSAPQQVRKRTWKFGQDTSPLQKILMFEKDQHVEKKSFFYTHILNFVVLHRHMTMLADIQICVYTDTSTHTCIRCE